MVGSGVTVDVQSVHWSAQRFELVSEIKRIGDAVHYTVIDKADATRKRRLHIKHVAILPRVGKTSADDDDRDFRQSAERVDAFAREVAYYRRLAGSPHVPQMAHAAAIVGDDVQNLDFAEMHIASLSGSASAAAGHRPVLRVRGRRTRKERRLEKPFEPSSMLLRLRDVAEAAVRAAVDADAKTNDAEAKTDAETKTETKTDDGDQPMADATSVDDDQRWRAVPRDAVVHLILVLEHVDGVSFANFIAGPSFRGATVHKVLRELQLAVATFTEAGIAHGDLHSSNVLVRPDGSVMVIDLGFSGDFGLFAPKLGYLLHNRCATRILAARDVSLFSARQDAVDADALDKLTDNVYVDQSALDGRRMGWKTRNVFYEAMFWFVDRPLALTQGRKPDATRIAHRRIVTWCNTVHLAALVRQAAAAQSETSATTTYRDVCAAALASVDTRCVEAAMIS